MRIVSKPSREAIARRYPPGTRVRAVRFHYEPGSVIDDNETVPPGTEGVVVGEPDGIGSVTVRWENGATLAFLVEDRVEIVALP